MSFKSLVVYFIVAFLILPFEKSQIQLACSQSLTPIDTASFNPQYINIFLQFIPPTKLEFQSQILIINNQLSLDGDFGKLIINGNPNFQFQENKLLYTYKATRLQISYPSLNKYWGNQTDFELIFTYLLESKTSNTVFPQLDQLMKNSLRLAIPVLSTSKEGISQGFTLLTNLSSFLNAQNYSSYPPRFNISSFDLENQFSENNYINNYKSFYFYVGNEVYGCEYNILWIIMNRFIIMSNPYSDYLKRYFDINSANVTQLVRRYYATVSFPNSNPVFQNFKLNEVMSRFDNRILNNSNSLLIYDKKWLLIMFTYLIIMF